MRENMFANKLPILIGGLTELSRWGEVIEKVCLQHYCVGGDDTAIAGGVTSRSVLC